MGSEDDPAICANANANPRSTVLLEPAGFVTPDAQWSYPAANAKLPDAPTFVTFCCAGGGAGTGASSLAALGALGDDKNMGLSTEETDDMARSLAGLSDEVFSSFGEVPARRRELLAGTQLDASRPAEAAREDAAAAAAAAEAA